MIDIAIEIPNEIIRKSCFKLIVELLNEINSHYSTGLNDIHKKKLIERIRNELNELKQYKEKFISTKDAEFPDYKELHNQLVEKSIIIDKQNEKIQTLHQFIHDIIKLLIHFVEMKEPYILSHSMKVAFLACSIIRNTDIDLDIQTVKYAALMHDIGRIMIHDNKVNLQRALSDDELHAIKQHTVEGYNLVKNLSFDKIIKDAILYHHESYDGTGYPKKLKGQDIPFIARIIKIADVYDALTSDRPHRLGHTKHEALAIMYNQKEKFDPQLLETFFIIM